LAKLLARHYGFAHLDSGSLYRLTALAVQEAKGDAAIEEDAVRAARAIDLSRAGDPAIRTDVIGRMASEVSAHPGVRAALLQFQRDFAEHPVGESPGAVIDGRDIGTVVCPDADVKLFIEADSKARMERRARQFEQKGQVVDRYALYHQIEERDARDRANPHGGFYPASDAHLLDTTRLDIEAALRAAVAIVDGVLAQKARH